jgi:two-component system CheB/CheR fusion protein
VGGDVAAERPAVRRAVAVLLSGTGSDGALGVQAIAEEGGVVFAQELQSAKFDGMPRSRGVQSQLVASILS